MKTKSGAVVSDQQLEQMAQKFESGEWPQGQTRILPGRPPLFDEELQPITFKEPKGKVLQIDKRAKQLGMSRSNYLRYLVDRDLAAV